MSFSPSSSVCFTQDTTIELVYYVSSRSLWKYITDFNCISSSSSKKKRKENWYIILSKIWIWKLNYSVSIYWISWMDHLLSIYRIFVFVVNELIANYDPTNIDLKRKLIIGNPLVLISYFFTYDPQLVIFHFSRFCLGLAC